MQAVDDGRDVFEEVAVDQRCRDAEYPGDAEDRGDLEADEEDLFGSAVGASASRLLGCAADNDDDGHADGCVGENGKGDRDVEPGEQRVSSIEVALLPAEAGADDSERVDDIDSECRGGQEERQDPPDERGLGVASASAAVSGGVGSCG